MIARTGFTALGLAITVSAVTVISAAQAQTTIPDRGSAASSSGSASHDVPSSVQDGRSDSLSSKLSSSGGVITPKGNVDPGIKAAAPVAQPNTTPVIPPSATGGQNAK